MSFCKSEDGIFLQLFVLLDFTRTSFGGSGQNASAGGRVKNVLYIIMTVTQYNAEIPKSTNLPVTLLSCKVFMMRFSILYCQSAAKNLRLV